MSIQTLENLDLSPEDIQDLGQTRQGDQPEQEESFSPVEALPEYPPENQTEKFPETEQPESSAVEKDEDSESASPPASCSVHTSRTFQLHLAEMETVDQIADLMPEISEAHREFNAAKEDMKAARKRLEAKQEELESLGQQLAEIRSGAFQQRLPFPNSSRSGIDPSKSKPIEGDDDHVSGEGEEEGSENAEENADGDGEENEPDDISGSHPISALGMTAKETEKLEEADITTIAELEKQIREDAWWHKKVQGFGPAKVDKLMDKLVEFRKEFPVPSGV